MLNSQDQFKLENRNIKSSMRTTRRNIRIGSLGSDESFDIPLAV